ncbi:PREDICTED: caspase-12-like isoform X1 [Myotis brandtii]|uniref:caspase-12-like isoform X1 n=2 Tax=Myotis brandtii TaxID=109478 RepID=UPI000704361F|nr:PREDICTED: caspase-12-like isoform X1 [Myotis brandtii]
MAGKRQKEDPIYKAKSIARNMIDGFFDDLIEKNVINKDELQRLGEGVDSIVNKTESLLEDITEKTEMTGKILMDRIFNPKKLLSLTAYRENEDSESENSESSSSTESENESEENEDEEKAESVHTLALPPTESRSENEDDETEEHAGLSQASVLPLTAPQETQASQPIHKLKLCPPDHFQRLKTTKADEIYPVMEKEGRTRLALIIHNKDFDHLCKRWGSEDDLVGMQDLLESLGYSVVVKENLTALEMVAVLCEFAARKEHRSSDSTILVFMSHGVLEGICGTKHRGEEPDILHDDTIFQIFNNRNCQSLRDKPKIIIMQACRGRGDGIVWVPDMGEASALKCCFWSDAVTKTHVEKDFIAFKSSTPHNSSWRGVKTGSFFISQIIYHFKEYAWCHHLEEIFRKVQHSFETPKELAQMPTIERVSMTRYFYLFPGN